MDRPAGLTPEEGRRLLEFAREAVRRAVLAEPPPETGNDPVFDQKLGAFVTVNVDHKLRGCIGHPLPRESLRDTLISCSRAAALEDPRFEPVRADELDRLDVEVSVLTLPRPIQDPGQVQVGTHGLIVGRGLQRGLLLPQVATTYGWDRETFLEHCCLKAGLEPDAWKQGASIEVFEAQVFP
jgi:AmmeMemoRadiSam system protein A